MANDSSPGTSSSDRLPTIYLPHGGGPWSIVDLKMGDEHELEALAAYLKTVEVDLPTPPRAVLLISAHWEAPQATVMSAAKPPMLYDYYGFPKEAYEFVWPAPGAPEVAGEVRERLEAAGFATTLDAERGFDHGAFVPLMLADPDAKVPTLQLSLLKGLDPAKHVALGRALTPLRDQGVLIVGSGMSYHNMRGFQMAFRSPQARNQMVREASEFDDWLSRAMGLEPDARETQLVEWEKAPSARASHPREEHLLPLHVVAGAALEDPATLPYRGKVIGAPVSAVHFG